MRTPKEQAQLLEELVKKDQKRRKKLQEAGIDYDYPEIVSPSNSYTEFLQLSNRFDNTTYCNLLPPK